MKNLDDLNLSINRLDLKKDDLLIVAFSAGPDSTALVYMLKELGYKNVKLAYVNYHDSEFVPIEQQLVNKTAKDSGYELFQNNVYLEDVKGQNFENWARVYRYNFFASLTKTLNAKGTLTAHHKDDLIETYLIQKSRNSLVTHYGLREISVINEINIYRPLLNYTKQDLIDYLNENQIPYYDDITNKNTSRLRNKIRTFKLNSEEISTLLAEIDLKNENLHIISEQIDLLCQKEKILYKEYLSLNDEIKKRLLWNKINQKMPFISEKKIQSLVNKCTEFLKKDKPGSIYLVDDYYLYQDSTSFFISKYLTTKPYEYVIEKSGVYSFETLSIDLTDSRIFNVFDYSYPIKIRCVQSGDKISTKLKTKNVKHFIKSQKVPVYLRNLYPVIEDKNGNIIYVPFYSDITNHLIPLTIKLIH